MKLNTIRINCEQKQKPKNKILVCISGGGKQKILGASC